MKRINFIEIVLENGEYVRLDDFVLKKIRLSNIRTEICGNYGKSLGEYTICDDVYLVVKKSIDETLQEGLFDRDCKVSKRLAEGNDITQIDVHYYDYPPKLLFVDFDGEYENKNQTGYIDEDGNVVIEIKNKDA